MAQTPSSAPEEKPTPPSGDLIRPVADFAAWEIRYSYIDDDAAGASPKRKDEDEQTGATDYSKLRPRRVVITRTKPLWHVKTERLNGNSVEQWSDGEEEFLNGSDMHSPILNTVSAAQLEEEGGQRPDALVDFSRAQFPGMAWLSAQNYVKTEEIEGIPVLIFKHAAGITVWIDAKTRYPVKWQSSGEQRTYHPLPQPGERLKLPASIARISAALKKDREILRRVPPRGG